MIEFLSLVTEFIIGLFDLPVPGLDFSFLQLALGLIVISVVGTVVFRLLFGGD